MQFLTFWTDPLILSLSADHGAAAIQAKLSEIVEMLLPAGYLLIDSTSPSVPSPTSPDGEQATEGETLQLSRAQTTSSESPPKPPSSIFGPACALRILAQNSESSVVPFGEKLTFHLYRNATRTHA